MLEPALSRGEMSLQLAVRLYGAKIVLDREEVSFQIAPRLRRQDTSVWTLSDVRDKGV